MQLVDSHEHGLDPKGLRSALGRFSTGVTVVTTTTASGRPVGLTVNSFSAVSLDPPLVLWSLRLVAASLPAFLAAGKFNINILSAEQQQLCSHFCGPSDDRFATIEHHADLHDCPVLPGSLASFACVTDRVIEAGDHMIFIGLVKSAHYTDGAPLVFAGGELGTLQSLSAVANAA